MGYVSEESFRNALDSIVVTREQRRTIQGMSKDDLQFYLANIYKSGFEDGAEAMHKKLVPEDIEEIRVDWEDVLSVISSIKDIEEKIVNEIDKKLRETYSKNT